MENFGKTQIYPEESEYGEKPEINLDEVAAKYAEKIRASLIEQKNNLTEESIKKSQMNIHLNRINPEELAHEDLIIYDKLAKGSLTEEELKKYCERLRNYFDEITERKKKEGEKFNFLDMLNHSRQNFLAMIRHLFENKKINEKLAERNKNNRKGY